MGLRRFLAGTASLRDEIGCGWTFVAGPEMWVGEAEGKFCRRDEDRLNEIETSFRRSDVLA
jgi:hypothetical protein